jgi:hypothetical protein
MSTHRYVYCEFWSDKWARSLTVDERLFFIYLLTNERVVQSGIYKLPMPYIVLEMQLTEKRIVQMIEKFTQLGKIIYNSETEELAIVNWRRYNESNSPKVKTCVKREVRNIKDINLVKALYGDEFNDILSINTVSIPYQYNTDTDPQNEIKKEKRKEKENKIEKEKILESEFKELWKEYPEGRRRGEVDALKFYKENRKNYSKEDFERALMEYKRVIKIEKKEDYIQYGKNFFLKGFIDYLNITPLLEEVKSKPSAPGNGGREGGRYISNDLTAEIEQEMREFEIRKREIEEAKRKEVIVSG